MRERGLCVDHTTIYRWVQRYAPEIDKRCRPFLRRTTDSYRIDETYVRVGGAWHYLYRGVDSNGDTLDFLLRATRDRHAAIAFFRKTVGASHTTPPRVVNVDKNPAYPTRSSRSRPRSAAAPRERRSAPAAARRAPGARREGHRRAGRRGLKTFGWRFPPIRRFSSGPAGLVVNRAADRRVMDAPRGGDRPDPPVLAEIEAPNLGALRGRDHRSVSLLYAERPTVPGSTTGWPGRRRGSVSDPARRPAGARVWRGGEEKGKCDPSRAAAPGRPVDGPDDRGDLPDCADGAPWRPVPTVDVLQYDSGASSTHGPAVTRPADAKEAAALVTGLLPKRWVHGVGARAVRLRRSRPGVVPGSDRILPVRRRHRDLRAAIDTEMLSGFGRQLRGSDGGGDQPAKKAPAPPPGEEGARP